MSSQCNGWKLCKNVGPEGISHQCQSFHKHGSLFSAPCCPLFYCCFCISVHFSFCNFLRLVSSPDIHLPNSQLLTIFILCCQRSSVVFVQREYIGSCLNLVCAVLHSPACKTCSLAKYNYYIFAFIHMKIWGCEVPHCSSTEDEINFIWLSYVVFLVSDKYHLSLL
jgi:hypothetical protein